MDPDYSRRTIIVLTKLDAVEPGASASDVLTGKVLKVKMGVVGVVNRSIRHKDKNVSLKDMYQREANFLLDNYPDIASLHGTPYLKHHLQRLLFENIKKTLPPLQEMRKMNFFSFLSSPSPDLDAIENHANSSPTKDKKPG